MDKHNIYSYNLYTLLRVKVGSSKEELYGAYERYKRLNTDDSVASNQILSILEEHFRILEQIGLEEYKKRVTKPKGSASDFEKWLDNPENQKNTYPAATAHAIDYENQFMKESTTDEVEFDISKVKNVNDAKIKKIGKKFVIIVLTVAVVVAGTLSILSLVNNSKGKYVDENSTSISRESEPETYTFKYIVQGGDTYVNILQKFGLYTPEANYENNTIYKGQVLQFTVTDKELAEEQQRIYDIQTIKPVMVEWDEYTIVSGDTPMSIADKFDVPVEYIIRFNASEYFSAIPDAHTCYAGYTINIPTKILTGEDAYNYNQAQIAEANSMKAVG